MLFQILYHYPGRIAMPIVPIGWLYTLASRRTVSKLGLIAVWFLGWAKVSKVEEVMGVSWLVTLIGCRPNNVCINRLHDLGSLI